METLSSRPNVLRRMYDWVVHWADHPAGLWVLFLLAIAESSFFPIPPDVLLIALAFGKPQKSFSFAGVCLVGSLIGGVLGYYIGWGIWNVVQDFFFTYVFSREVFESVGSLYGQYSFWAIFAAGFTPIPYKVFTVSAGVFQINFWGFLLASLLGRGGRFFLVAALIRIFGEKARYFIEKYFNLAVLVFTVLLIGSFFLIKFLI